jgi:hypothetical protein
MPVNRKLLAFRKLEKAVRILFRIEEASLSGLQHGRLAADLRRTVSSLKPLTRDDPEEKFWPLLQEAILKTVDYLRRRV